jgi:peptidoglycan/xylan/chitin deacetylase (PgdA/CDA1 family)
VHGKPETDLVGLSFDAGGRDGGQTGLVLDTLEKLGVHATFFLTGEWAEANPALVRRMAAEGHELANHTFDHPHLPKVSDQEILSQVSRTEQLVQKVASVALVKYVRPPFGDFDQRVNGVLEGHGYDVIYWTLDSGDWRAEMSVQDVTQRVETKANAGDIVVFHCYPAKTAQALPGALEGLKARGLKLGTVSQALGRQ